MIFLKQSYFFFSIPKSTQKKPAVANVAEKNPKAAIKTSDLGKSNSKDNNHSEKTKQRKPQDSSRSEEAKVSKNTSDRQKPKKKVKGQRQKVEKESSPETKGDDAESKVPQPHSLLVDTSLSKASPQRVSEPSKEPPIPSQTPKYSPIGPRQNKSSNRTGNNAPATVQEDDSFSVSGGSLSSTSQFSHVESVNHIAKDKQTQSNFFRPPPGLAPPPGFASTDKLPIPSPENIIPTNNFTTSQDDSEMSLSHNSLLSSLLSSQQDFTDRESNLGTLRADSVENIQSELDGDKPLLGLGQDLNVENNQHDADDEKPLLGLGQDFNVDKSQPELDDEVPLLGLGQDFGVENTQPDVDDEKPLLGLGQEDFNVMNFLSFLDDGIHADDSIHADENTNVPIEEENNRSLLYGSNNTSVQANPWERSGKSRALAYGIDVEAGNNGDNGIQLLTPSIILGQNSSSTDQEREEVDEDDIFDFANLLSG